MNDRKSFEGIQYYKDASGNGILYFPDIPVPQTDSNGDPMISLIGAGPQWFLQLSSKWAVSDDSLNKLAEHLLGEEIIQSRSDLKQAPLQINKAELILFMDGEERVLASSKTSGHYPFIAVFNTTISEQRQREVAAAFNGKKNALYVKYYASLDTETPIEIAISGPIHTVRESLSEESSIEEIKDWIDQQIEENHFKIEIRAEENISPETLQQTRENLVNQTVEEIQAYLSREDELHDHSLLELSNREALGASEQIISTSDISTWFKNNSSEHIKIIK